jgi:hypothetical protein
VTIVDASVTPTPLAVVRVLLAMPDPSPRGHGADGEPHDTGRTAKHVTMSVEAVPMHVVVLWHMKERN